MNKNIFNLILNEFLNGQLINNLNIGTLSRFEIISEFDIPQSQQVIARIIGTDGIKNIYVKVFKNTYRKPPHEFKRGIENIFRTNLFWYKKLLKYKEFTTFKPLYYSPNFNAIITEEARGVNLGKITIERTRFLPSKLKINLLSKQFKKAGKLLRIFQNFAENDSTYDLKDLMEDVDIRLKILVQNSAVKFSINDRNKILKFYQSYLKNGNFSSIPTGYVHGDYTMGNILVNEEELILHDFGKTGTGPRFFDLTRFYHQLELLRYKPIFHKSAISILQRAFLEGYGFGKDKNDVLFNLFLLRHYFSHYVGIARSEELSIKSKMYNKWVMKNHKKQIQKIIMETYAK
ncbi:MAG: phosphotransferase [Promethearchaeota archaeon]